MKNNDIAKAFNDGETAKNSNGSFYTEKINGVIIAFSYGYHFPICIKFNDGVLFNKNGYSRTTARHKNLILSYVKYNILSDEDFKTTEELKRIVDKIKYNGVKSKAELIEQKI